MGAGCGILSHTMVAKPVFLLDEMEPGLWERLLAVAADMGC